MQNRVHYGEFTLDYWVKQLLSGKIELPEYQRSFVWSKKQVAKLMESLSDHQFVPPVTIGVIADRNIIIDGQQRLTSILLAYLNLFPSAKAYLRTVMKESDEPGEPEEEIFFKWTLRELQKNWHGNIAELKDTLNAAILDDGTSAYESLGISWITEEWLKNKYLGFSYIVPTGKPDDEAQYKFYSSIFRNINIGGIPLRNDESREAMYYLRRPFVPLFKPGFLQSYTVTQVGDRLPVDFVRILAIVSQYAKTRNEGIVLKKFSGIKRLEDYIMEYISAVLDDSDDIFKKFSDIMNVEDIVPRLNHLETEFRKLNLPINFSGIIEVDNYLFGLVFYCFLMNKSIKENSVALLKARLQDNIRIQKKDDRHSKSPNQLGHVRLRLSKSLAAYKRYIE